MSLREPNNPKPFTFRVEGHGHHRRVGGTWFNWKRPYDERGKPRHSAKPGEFMQMVEEVSPGPYLEMFARNNRPGWDSWGNECESVALPQPLFGT